MRHIEEVIRLNGGNEYYEGTAKDMAEKPKRTRGVALNRNVYRSG